MSNSENKMAKEPNNVRITDALTQLDNAIDEIRHLGQKINGTQSEDIDEKAAKSEPPALAKLINELPERLNKARETIHGYINEIRDMIL